MKEKYFKKQQMKSNKDREMTYKSETMEITVTILYLIYVCD